MLASIMAIITAVPAFLLVIIVIGILSTIVAFSFHRIGPTEVGLVTKKFSLKKLGDNIVAMKGEAGYQADMLMPGWRFKLCLLYSVEKFPWVQIPAGQIGVVIAQVGAPLPTGAKSGVYKKEFGSFSDLRIFISDGGEKGVQRPVLPPGSTLPIHPVAFLVITKNQVFGRPTSPEYKRLTGKNSELSCASFNLEPEQLEVFRINRPDSRDSYVDDGGRTGADQQEISRDMIGIVTTNEGDPLPSGAIAGRLGNFDDISKLESDEEGAHQVLDASMTEMLLGSKNNLHNNYQDFQSFLDSGGRIGLQHDPLLYGAYLLNPFLVKVERVPMLVIEQGQVAVIKSYVGLPTKDTSGTEFKFGSLVRPGHQGIWQESLRTGKYALNPTCYNAMIVPTSILTLNWAQAVSTAHNLDARLQQIEAKSSEGFVFKIDLQVQIHIPDTNASKVISTVGTVSNLIDEVLQAAVGNHFRNTLQSMPAVKFIETRQKIQEEAFNNISAQLSEYYIETRGVYIQDVVFPQELVEVLTQREIAKQKVDTYKQEKSAEDQRIEMENSRGIADQQADLAKSKVSIEVKTNNSTARKAEADGEATYIEKIGIAKGAEVRAVGLANAEAYERQVSALGQQATALINVADKLAKGNHPFVPKILAMGGGRGESGSSEGLMATLMGLLEMKTGEASATMPAGNGSEKSVVEESVATQERPVVEDLSEDAVIESGKKTQEE